MNHTLDITPLPPFSPSKNVTLYQQNRPSFSPTARVNKVAIDCVLCMHCVECIVFVVEVAADVLVLVFTYCLRNCFTHERKKFATRSLLYFLCWHFVSSTSWFCGSECECHLSNFTPENIGIIPTPPPARILSLSFLPHLFFSLSFLSHLSFSHSFLPPLSFSLSILPSQALSLSLWLLPISLSLTSSSTP